MSRARRVLAVDDQKDFLDAISHEVRGMGHDVISASSGEEAFALASQDPMDLIISDVRMPGWDGRRLLVALRKIQRSTPPFLFMTGYSDISFSEAYHLGADGFIAKPFVRSTLNSLVKHFLTPIEERFINHGFSPKAVSIWRAHPRQEQFQLGRGGFALAGVMETVSSKIGDFVDFWVDVPGHDNLSLKGTGKIEWLHADDLDAPPTAGVRIICLDERCNQWFSAFVKSEEPLSLIPVLGHKPQGDAS